MFPRRDSNGNYYSHDSTTPFPLNTSLNHNTNTPTTPNFGFINLSFNPITNTTTTTSSHVISSSLNPNTITTTQPSQLTHSLYHNTCSTTAATALVVNTIPNNNVVIRSEASSDVASTSYHVNDNNNMNMNYLQCHSEFPPGYRFCPTDGELIFHYLERRIMNLKRPHDMIKDVNLYDTTPDRLSEEYEPVGENEWYFFTPRDRKYKNGSRPNRAAGTSLGYWKATGAVREISHPENPEQIIGHKRSLVFYNGEARNGSKSNWIMQEFKRQDSSPSETSNRKRLHENDMGLDLVLCKIYHNKSDKSSKGNINMDLATVMEANPHPAPEGELPNMGSIREQLPPIPGVRQMTEDEAKLYGANNNTSEHDFIVNNYPQHGMQQPMYDYSHYTDYQQGFYNYEKPLMNPPPVPYQGDSSSGLYQGEPSAEKGFYTPEKDTVENQLGSIEGASQSRAHPTFGVDLDNMELDNYKFTTSMLLSPTIVRKRNKHAPPSDDQMEWID